MKKSLCLILYFISLSCLSQNQDLEKFAKEIEAEGKYLYRLEVAAWHGSDIFMENYKGERPIGGYFSYIDSKTPKCLFFSKEKEPKVIGVVSFGDIQIIETATIDFKVRDFKRDEKELYSIRQKALDEIKQDSLLFKNYTNANLNLIPSIDKNKKHVYILTAPKIAGVVLFGNDYLLTFDKSNKLLSKEEIHRNLIPIQFDENRDSLVFHTHKTDESPFITPTDICTLMLYAKFAEWKKHYVASEEYVSIWDCQKEELQIVTKDEFDKMNHEDL